MRPIHSFIILAGVLTAPLTLRSETTDAAGARNYDGGFTRESYTEAFVAPSEPKDAPASTTTASPDTTSQRGLANISSRHRTRRTTRHSDARFASKANTHRSFFGKFLAWWDGHVPDICPR